MFLTNVSTVLHFEHRLGIRYPSLKFPHDNNLVPGDLPVLSAL